MDEARAAELHPAALFGPARTYAEQLARASRVAVAEPLNRQSGGVVLRLSSVGKTYGRRRVLGDVDLEVRAGQVVAVVGANGAGKSTLLEICAGLQNASEGKVERVPHVGWVPQSGGTYDLLSAQEHFELFGGASRIGRGRSRATGERLAARLGWRPRAQQPVSELSGGTKQKLNLILGELSRPELLLLDEPYQGFDRGSYADFWGEVRRWRESGTAVVVVTHLLHEPDEVDHVLELLPHGGPE
ncbi:ATP-binding cassette domain-containing protein [Aeromicrobium sp. 9AM]|uniref:ATP-binding cassette domain-containing protein n=1 Tax=Aeromicrobium sp. 9AM TaxID=2653126 RepID=UPI00352A0E66